MKKIFPAILLTVILVILLFACAEKPIKQPSAEEALSSALQNFEEKSCHSITGKILKNNEVFAEISAVTDFENKRILLNYNLDDYLYFGTYFIKKTNKYVIENYGTSYAETVKKYLPFSVNGYVYDKNNRNEIYLTGNKIVITFLNNGVKNSFASNENASGGVFTITLRDGEIIYSTLATTVTENGVSVPLYVSYDYQNADNAFDETPWISPNDTLGYAKYAMTVLSDKYNSATIKTGNKRDTETRLSALVISDRTVKKIATLDNGDDFILRVEYISPLQVSVLLSSIKNFEIRYDKNYDIKRILINDTEYKLS